MAHLCSSIAADTLEGRPVRMIGNDNKRHPKEQPTVNENGLSAYELKRLENIRQNQQILASLNIPKPVITATAVVPSSAKRPVKKRSSVVARKKTALPLRTSSRLRDKAEELKTGKKSRRTVGLLREFPAAVPKAPRVRAPITTRLAFDPEFGATDHFLQTITDANADVRPKEKGAVLPGKAMAIKGEPGVAKIVQERIYSIALHPGCGKVLAATGSKAGCLGFWDATEFYLDPEMPVKPPTSFLFHPHSDSISTLRYNPSNTNQLFSCAYDGLIQCMDMSKGHFDPIPIVEEDGEGESYLSSFDFLDDSGWNLCVADMSGVVSFLDRREARRPSTFQLHPKKIGGISVSQADTNIFATCSLDNTVCLWDRRSLKSEDSVPLVRIESRRAVTAVNFHPTLRDCLVSTCYDDHVRIYKDSLGPASTNLAIPHNNQTGRWITTFKALWDPKSSPDLSHSSVIIGDMNRGIDLIAGDTGITNNYTSEWLTAQPAVNAAHPSLNLIVSGNASGKLALWTPF